MQLETIMNLSLRPEVEKFIGDQVKEGRFSSAEAVVEEAIKLWREVPPVEELDDETAAAINEAEAQADRGEGMELAQFRSHISERFVGNG
jgi:putative addiction module CopG family antidote